MGRRFVSIWFPNLTIDWHIRKQPQLRNVAFALKGSLGNRMVITAASVEAQTHNVYKGMVLADAKSILSSLKVIDDKPTLANQLVQRIAEWCIRFTPTAAPDAPDGVLLEATGCTHLWGGEEVYLKDISKRLSDRGYTTRVAIADTIGAAWALARYSHESISPQNEKESLAILPVEGLRLEAETIDRLKKLGLRQVKDVLPISATALRRRFGPRLSHRLAQALGYTEELLVPVYPAEAYSERLPCLEPIITLAGIEIALQRLLSALCNRLKEEGKGLRNAFFRGHRTDGNVVGIEVSTSRPSQSEAHLFSLFTLKLSAFEPAGGIELFLLEATKVEDYKPSQGELWEDGLGGGERELAELIDRLTSQFGAEAVHQYLPAEHWWPERSFKKTSGFTAAPVIDWKVERPKPLSLLNPPEGIEVTAPIPDYPPLSFRHKGILHKIAKADGPERIEREWWISDGEHRDYYCVEDEEGRRYWLFRSGHYTAQRTERWYLHGFFP